MSANYLRLKSFWKHVLTNVTTILSQFMIQRHLANFYNLKLWIETDTTESDCTNLLVAAAGLLRCANYMRGAGKLQQHCLQKSLKTPWLSDQQLPEFSQREPGNSVHL